MSFCEAVCNLVDEGVIPAAFRVADVFPYLGNRFSRNYINTALANNAEGGNYTRHGSRPRFRRVSHGLYQLIQSADL